MIQDIRTFRKDRVPGQVVIQITDRCNARCPQCGMRVTNPFQRSTLGMDVIRRIIDHAASTGVRAISFTGGEPLLDIDTLIDLIHYAGSSGIEFLRTGTNGYLFSRPHQNGFHDRIGAIAEKLARTPLRNFWISIDSTSSARHEAMRGFLGVVRGIEKALPVFHRHGLFPSANLGINRNMGGQPIAPLTGGATGSAADSRRFSHDVKTAFRRFFRFVIDMGFTIANVCYPMSTQTNDASKDLAAVYRADSENAIVSFTSHEKSLLFKGLLEVIPEFRSQIRIFTPLCSLHSLSLQQARPDRKSEYPCRGGIDFFYINAQDGNTYPCGYRGAENLGKYWHLNIQGKKDAVFCRRCEWECFRDPSELLGPFLEMASNPFVLIRRWIRDPAFYRLWIQDALYYQACGYFNGRVPPDFNRLAFFKTKDAH